MICFRSATLAGLAGLLLAAASQAQPLPAPKAAPAKKAPPKKGPGGQVALSPSLFELPLPPGGSKTVVVNVLLDADNPRLPPQRLVANLNDWDLDEDGTVVFARAGSGKHSAASWFIFSPAEVTVVPNRPNPVRVTVTVPKSAAPGDYTTALIIEPRPASLKQATKGHQITFRFRLAATFYVMVTPLHSKCSLEGLRADHEGKAFVITSTLRNQGNGHVRPVHSAVVLDGAGKEVARAPETSTMPLLRGHLLRARLSVVAPAGRGTYQVRYRVSFKDGRPIQEGRTTLAVP